ncbi:MAG: hypothetical protein A2Y38_25420 [Spirochaetes bacterium GWB1_59_5]|nr:MAG: hypothetical protein A2Y38_25420 [Spirochaetes bacterium GWB1_59_5]
MSEARVDGTTAGARVGRLKTWGLLAVGWFAFILGWLGVFLPGLPTTIFWIIAAVIFLRTNKLMYARIIAHKRFGPGIKLFVEEGQIRRRGKVISITAMMCFAVLGSIAIPVVWVKFVVVGAAAAGSIWVAVLPTPESAAETSARSVAAASANER